MTRFRLAVPIFLIALGAYAQYVPPVPKSVTGGRALNRTKDIALPSPKQQWVRARSTHFLTLSAAGERRTRDVVDRLETIAVALRQLDPHFAAEGDLTRLILFGRSRDAAPYFELLVGRQSPGAFVVNSEGTGTMLIDGSRTDADRTVFHELVHNLLANSGTRLPLWLEEGMADYFSTASVGGGTVRFGDAIREHNVLVRNSRLMKIDDLFAVENGSPAAASGHFYAESWAVVDWLMRANAVAFYRFVNDVDHGMKSIDALEKEFHVNAALIEHSIETGQTRPVARVTVPVEGSQQATATTPISRDEAIIELARFLSGFEATRKDAERFLTSVDSRVASAVAVLASMRAKERQYDEAVTLYEKALELAPQDSEVRLAFAESLLGNAMGPFAGTVEIDSGSGPAFRRARQLATVALAAGADAARANAVIGTSYLVESDVTPGIAALRRARELRPVRYDVALNLYALLFRSGDSESADRVYKDLSSRAQTPQATFAARAVYVREQLALVNRLIHSNQMNAAAASLEKLIAVTQDPAAKMDLQRQLMNLREIDDANRQILAYNDAINASNRGETAKAIKILDNLLETATDPKVVRDAMALRKQLEKRAKGMRRRSGG